MKYFTPSNCLTLSRLFLAPVLLPYAICYFIGHAFFIFSVMACTDYLDGVCARWSDSETQLGAWLDPLADKVLLISVMLPLVSLHIVHWVVALVCVTREFIVLSVRYVAALHACQVRVSWWGKWKTVFQFSYLAVCLMPALQYVPYLMSVVVSCLIVTTVGSMLQYIYHAVRESGSRVLS